MSDVLGKSIEHNFAHALGVLEAAIGDCPDELWEIDLWPDEASTTRNEYGALVGSAPWLLAHHALTILDYDSTGDFEMWVPPTPFDDNTWGEPNRVFTKSEMLAYVEFCRGKVAEIVGRLDDESAARPLPQSHRYAGTLYGVILGSLPVHTVEHASQIRQFLTMNGVKPSAAARRASGDNVG